MSHRQESLNVTLNPSSLDDCRSSLTSARQYDSDAQLANSPWQSSDESCDESGPTQQVHEVQGSTSIDGRLALAGSPAASNSSPSEAVAERRYYRRQQHSRPGTQSIHLYDLDISRALAASPTGFSIMSGLHSIDGNQSANAIGARSASGSSRTLGHTSSLSPSSTYT